MWGYLHYCVLYPWSLRAQEWRVFLSTNPCYDHTVEVFVPELEHWRSYHRQNDKTTWKLKRQSINLQKATHVCYETSHFEEHMISNHLIIPWRSSMLNLGTIISNIYRTMTPTKFKKIFCEIKLHLRNIFLSTEVWIMRAAHFMRTIQKKPLESLFGIGKDVLNVLFCMC